MKFFLSYSVPKKYGPFTVRVEAISAANIHKVTLPYRDYSFRELSNIENIKKSDVFIALIDDFTSIDHVQSELKIAHDLSKHIILVVRNENVYTNLYKYHYPILEYHDNFDINEFAVTLAIRCDNIKDEETIKLFIELLVNLLGFSEAAVADRVKQ